MLFESLPLEIVERILFYLKISDIAVALTAFNTEYCKLSEYFWKNVCLRENILKEYSEQEWHECFQIGLNKYVGNYSLTNFIDVPVGILEHVHSKAIITHCFGELNTYNVYICHGKNKFHLVQQIEGNSVEFKEELVLLNRDNNILIYAYNYDRNIFDIYKTLPKSMPGLVTFDKNHCVWYDDNHRSLCLYQLSNLSHETIELPRDIKTVFPAKNMLYSEDIVLSVLSLENTYKIKVFNIKSGCWTLDLVFFASTGMSNDPNVWVGSNFIGGCDVTFRSLAIYYGLFKIWDKKGKLLFQEGLKPSNKHYLHCFFKDNLVFLTTSDTTLNIGDNSGNWISRLETNSCFYDIQLSTGNLLFILYGNSHVDVFDYKRLEEKLYTIVMKTSFCAALSSYGLYCPYDIFAVPSAPALEVINFY